MHLNDAGDVDVEPFGDLSQEEGQELIDFILTNEEINDAFPCDS